MNKVLLELSVSLDGFVAGPDDGPDALLGQGGERLHEWMFAGKAAAESQSFEALHFRDIGALIMGRRMVDLGVGPWGDEPTFHAPCFVVTHRSAETVVKRGGTSYIFITDGIRSALRDAQEAAGAKHVLVNGGADLARQFLNAGLVDELRLHLVPVILGAGVRLFDGVHPEVRLVAREAHSHPGVTHLIYDLGRAAASE